MTFFLVEMNSSHARSLALGFIVRMPHDWQQQKPARNSKNMEETFGLSPDCPSKASAAALVLHDDLLQVGLQLWIDRQSAFEIAREERGLLLHPGAGICGPESFWVSELQ